MRSRIFDPNKEEVTRNGKKLRNKEYHLYNSYNNIRIIKLREMNEAGHVASLLEKRNAYRIFVNETSS
jgi:hypothetical protein